MLNKTPSVLNNITFSWESEQFLNLGRISALEGGCSSLNLAFVFWFTVPLYFSLESSSRQMEVLAGIVQKEKKISLWDISYPPNINCTDFSIYNAPPISVY